MRPRNALLLAFGSLVVLLTIVALLAREPGVDRDLRPSTFGAGPGGARALLDGLVRLGVPVRRFRDRPRDLASAAADSGTALAVLGPSFALSAPERRDLLAFGEMHPLVIAGPQAESLMRCFGYRVAHRPLDSARVTRPGAAAPGAPVWVRATLVPTGIPRVVDSSRAYDVGRIACEVPAWTAVEPLLSTEGGRLAAVRLRRATGTTVVLVADEELFRNRTVRKTWAGPFVLGLLAEGHARVIFDEFHHGFGPSGSLGALALSWSRRSPWGWLVWQTAAVGGLALLFGAVRFGPAVPGISRVRRSALEHVRALAHALAAARGHDVAIGAMVRGLRRRLIPPGLRSRGDWRAWLSRLGRGSVTPRAREALDRLDALTRPGQPPEGVLRAANAVEDLWQELRPSRPTT